MMRIVMVRYTVKADQVEENERLVRAVYEELAQSAPEGLRYATFKLEDGRSFMHLAAVADEAENPLTRQPAFAEFQREIADRCETQPVVTTLEEVGSYRLLGVADAA
jgi:quinol monooxygenase YgiN